MTLYKKNIKFMKKQNELLCKKINKLLYMILEKNNYYDDYFINNAIFMKDMYFRNDINSNSIYIDLFQYIFEHDKINCEIISDILFDLSSISSIFLHKIYEKFITRYLKKEKIFFTENEIKLNFSNEDDYYVFNVINNFNNIDIKNVLNHHKNVVAILFDKYDKIYI